MLYSESFRSQFGHTEGPVKSPGLHASRAYEEYLALCLEIKYVSYEFKISPEHFFSYPAAVTIIGDRAAIQTYAKHS